MRILSIIKTLKSSHGGPPEVLRNQLISINKKEHIISVLKLDTLKLFFLFKCLILRKYRLKMYNFLKKVDIVHFHEIWNIKIIFIVYFCNKLLIKHFFVGHGYLDDWSIKQGFIKKKFFLKFLLQPAYNSSIASFFSTTDEMVEAKKNIKVHKPFIIPNGVSLNKYKKRNLILKQKKKILFFGRIHKKKGLNLLLNTIKKLPDDYFDDFCFEITGPGHSKDIINLIQMISDLSLKNRVNYNPPIYGNDKINYLNMHDVFLLPSIWEGFGYVLAEAALCSLPSIAFNISSNSQIIQDGKTGVLVTEQNPLSFADAVLKLSENEKLRQEMGEAAKSFVKQNFENNGISTVSSNGSACIKLICPQPYSVIPKNSSTPRTYFRHFHFVISNKEKNEWLPQIYTKILICKYDYNKTQSIMKTGLCVLINALPCEYFAKDHIPNSFNFFNKDVKKIFQKDLFKWFNDVIKIHYPKLHTYIRNKKLKINEVPIITYCAHNKCNASQLTAEELMKKGFVNISEYSGGMKDYRIMKKTD